MNPFARHGFSLTPGMVTRCVAALAMVHASGAAGTDFLGEIVVEGRQPVTTRMAPTYTFDRELIQLRDDSGLDQVLELVPNLNVRVGGQGVPRIDIRGLRTRQTLFLVNGIPFNSTFDGQFDPTLIPTDYVDSVRVTTGGASELYGAGALSVINVLTRAERESSLELSGEAGPDESHRLGLSAGGSAGDLDYLVSLSRRARESFELPHGFTPTSVENGGNRDNSDSERNNLFLNLGYAVTPSLQLGLTASAVFGEYGTPSSIINDSNDPFASTPTFERVDDQEGYTLQGSFVIDRGGPWDLRGWLYGNWLDQDENRYDDANLDSIDNVAVKGTFLTTTETRITGAKLLGSYAVTDAVRVGLAAHRQHDDWQQTGVIRDVTIASSGTGTGRGRGTSTPATYGLRTLDTSADLGNSSLAAEVEIDATDRVGMIIGAGSHWQERSGVDDHATTYSLGADFDATDRLNLSASWARKVRFASIRQLYDAAAGDPTLSPEILRGLDLGARYALDEATTVSLAAFNYDIDDFIERDRTTDRFANVDEARLRGIDVGVRTRLLERLLVQLNYGFLDTRDKSGSGRDELQNRPEHTVAFDLDYAVSTRGGVHLKVLHIADQVYYTRRAPYVQAQLPDSTRVDLGLRWQPMAFPLTFTVGIENLFDEYAEDEFALPNPGRYFYVGFRWKH